MKAFVIGILLLVGADVAMNHGANTLRVLHGIAGAFTSVGDSFADSVFSK